ncbi:MAG: RnfH family protein, partial [Pseudomonadota bacterium]
EIDLTVNKVGIFGTVAKLDKAVKEGDRVEIYRPIHPDAELLEKRS